VVIGGLLSSLFLTLIVVPVIYQIVDNMMHRFGWDKPELPIDELAAEPYDHKEVLEY
jgi:HAE1 family hydrophobic/amphiphilic exporter-1